MTKEDLLKFSASDIAKKPTLFAEFNRIFKEENGRGCSRCQLRNVISKWRIEVNQNKQQQNTSIMAKAEKTSKGTFQLKVANRMLPFGDGVNFLTDESSDNQAVDFINFKKGKYEEHRKGLFLKLPDSMMPKKSTPKSEKKEEPAKPKVKVKPTVKSTETEG